MVTEAVIFNTYMLFALLHTLQFVMVHVMFVSAVFSSIILKQQCIKIAIPLVSYINFPPLVSTLVILSFECFAWK